MTVEVSVIAPNVINSEFQGQLRVENQDNSSDFGFIPVYLKTPRNQATSNILSWRLSEKFPLLQKLLFK